MTETDLQTAWDQSFTECKTYIDRNDDILVAKIAALEARIACLEQRTHDVKFCGAWVEDHEYKAGNLTVSSGSLWSAQAQTKSRPGTDANWQLCVKRGEFSK
jgi:hypothetical protein